MMSLMERNFTGLAWQQQLDRAASSSAGASGATNWRANRSKSTTQPRARGIGWTPPFHVRRAVHVRRDLPHAPGRAQLLEHATGARTQPAPAGTYCGRPICVREDARGELELDVAHLAGRAEQRARAAERAPPSPARRP